MWVQFYTILLCSQRFSLLMPRQKTFPVGLFFVVGHFGTCIIPRCFIFVTLVVSSGMVLRNGYSLQYLVERLWVRSRSSRCMHALAHLGDRCLRRPGLRPAPFRASFVVGLTPYRLANLVALAIEEAGQVGSKERTLPALWDFRSTFSILILDQQHKQQNNR